MIPRADIELCDLAETPLVCCRYQRCWTHRFGRWVPLWASFDAAVVLGAEFHTRAVYEQLKRKHPPGKAMTILAHKIGRTVYFMLRRQTAFDMARFVGS